MQRMHTFGIYAVYQKSFCGRAQPGPAGELRPTALPRPLEGAAKAAGEESGSTEGERR